ncbi:phosphoglycolate phosphatase [Pseudomonas protegens]|uniref:HAD hydrolase-like protein n=1 Tax=Pseudomonas TaxID=286 RepID=UPI000F475E5C|nr:MULTISPECIES: HAD hydrolase-like protein [Pseudomonas]MCS4259870.1 phosphoglycolate phosphatase [Pseudomonas sp. BIGb0176]ROQ57025.1 phosphoglycolate phosphatase [Pseudomonas protegens]ROQ84874.1 phosphoglycolate phosphatase [Pseudomonas protegens]
MSYRLVIFDFDGTLADSFPFFVSVFNQVADRHAFSRIHPQELDCLRKLGAREIMAHPGMPRWKLPMVARTFMGLMKKHQSAIPLFDNIAQTLSHLDEKGLILAVVSSNSRENITHILGASCRHIRALECGVSIFGKASRLRRVMRRFDVEREQVIYIGDQPMDGEAAATAGIAFGAVAWGYGAYDAFHRLQPQEWFADVSEFGGYARNRLGGGCAARGLCQLRRLGWVQGSAPG